MFQKLINFFKDEEGATMVEYALMLALIAIVCITAVKLIGTNANATFGSAATAVGNAS
jgi:pilus assembly protein Flp/PilA